MKTRALFAIAICLGMLGGENHLAGQRVLACSSDPSCGHIFSNGQDFKWMKTSDAFVMVSVVETVAYMRADVLVTNLSSTPFDVIPAQFLLSARGDKPKILRYASPQDMIRRANKKSVWQGALQGAGNAMQANRTTTTESPTSGSVTVYNNDGSSVNGTYQGTVTTTTTGVDPAIRSAQIQDAVNREADLKTKSAALMANSFLSSTIAAGQTKTGAVYFERNKKRNGTILSLPINGTFLAFEF